MSRANKTVSGVLAADVANLGTFVVSYPNHEAPEIGMTDAGRFYNATEHRLIVASSNTFAFPIAFDLTFGAANITVTNRSGGTWLAGSPFTLELKERGDQVYADDGKTKIAQAKKLIPVLVNLGAPDALSATAICAAQAIAGAVNATINGTIAANGAVTLDVPRGVSVVSSNAADTTQVITVHGFDAYGVGMRENLTMNGTTTRNGLKAFKRITRVQSSAALAGNLSVGNTDVLGLPLYVPSLAHVTTQIQDGAVAAAGAFVAGIRTAGGSTATTGDVRGTYDPNSACDGARVFELICLLPEAGSKGIPQFNG